MTYNIPTWTISDTDCTIVYTLTKNPSGAYDTAVITSFTASPPSLTVYTTSAGKLGTYSLLIKGSVSGYTNSAIDSLNV
jgi:hypothetical protein